MASVMTGRLMARGARLLSTHSVRAFRASKPAQAGSPAEMMKEFVTAADYSTGLAHFYHKLNWAICGLTPLALLLSPSGAALPVDLALGISIPVHFQISGHMLISDYAPLILGNALGKALWVQNGLRMAVTATTAFTIIGLTKLNLQGPGLAETFKSLWREPARK